MYFTCDNSSSMKKRYYKFKLNLIDLLYIFQKSRVDDESSLENDYKLIKKVTQISKSKSLTKKSKSKKNKGTFLMLLEVIKFDIYCHVNFQKSPNQFLCFEFILQGGTIEFSPPLLHC